MTPQTIGRYRVESILGAGGFATVYLAADPHLEAPVAIKVLANNLVADPEIRERFIREARTMRQLETPGLVTIYDIGEHEGAPYFVMEYCPRGTLSERLKSIGRPLTVDEGLVLVSAIEGCTSGIHRANMVHRDLKPGNFLIRHQPLAVTGAASVLLNFDEELVVADFGLAKAVSYDETHLSLAGGTPGYSAPEQFLGDATVDATADVYAASAIVAAAISGTLPRPVLAGRKLPFDDASMVMTGPLAPELAKGMAHERNERHNNITAWANALVAAKANEAARPAPADAPDLADPNTSEAVTVAFDDSDVDSALQGGAPQKPAATPTTDAPHNMSDETATISFNEAPTAAADEQRYSPPVLPSEEGTRLGQTRDLQRAQSDPGFQPPPDPQSDNQPGKRRALLVVGAIGLIGALVAGALAILLSDDGDDVAATGSTTTTEGAEAESDGELTNESAEGSADSANTTTTTDADSNEAEKVEKEENEEETTEMTEEIEQELLPVGNYASGGITQAQAEAMVRSDGFTPSVTFETSVEPQQDGYSIGQSPGPGSQLEKGGTVRLAIGRFEGHLIPDVVGLPWVDGEVEVQQAVRTAGFTSTTTEDHICVSSNGGVIQSHDPPAFTEITGNLTLNFTITVVCRPVPPIQDMVLADALPELQAWQGEGRSYSWASSCPNPSSDEANSFVIDEISPSVGTQAPNFSISCLG